MRSYSLLLIKTCHRRGVHAMGGMAAQIPIKNNPQANEAALVKVPPPLTIICEACGGHEYPLRWKSSAYKCTACYMRRLYKLFYGQVSLKRLEFDYLCESMWVAL